MRRSIICIFQFLFFGIKIVIGSPLNDSLSNLIEGSDGYSKFRMVVDFLEKEVLCDSLEELYVAGMLEMARDYSPQDQAIAHYYSGSVFSKKGEQKKVEDELNTAIELLNEDKRNKYYIKSIFKMLENMVFSGDSATVKYFKLIEEALDENMDTASIADYYSLKAMEMQLNNMHPEAIVNSSKAIEYAKLINDTARITGCANIRITSCYAMADLENAKSDAILILTYWSSVTIDHVVRAKIDLGMIYFGLNEIEKSKKYLLEGYNEAKNTGITALECRAILGLSNVYRVEDKLDSARYYISNILDAEKDVEPGYRILAFTNMARLYLIENDYYLARKYLFKAYYIDKKTGENTLGKIELTIDMASYYSETEHFTLAEKYFDSAYFYINKTNQRIQLPHYYEQYMEHNIKKNDFKMAFETSLLLSALKDSASSYNSKVSSEEQRIRYELDKYEKQTVVLVNNLEVEKKENKEFRNKNRYLTITLLVSSILFIPIIVVLLINWRKNRVLQDLRVKKIGNLEKEGEFMGQQNATVSKQLEISNSMLASANSHILQQSMITSKLVDWLKSLRKYTNAEGKREIQTKLAEISTYSVDNNWHEFERNFSIIYPGVIETLRKEVIGLSKHDYRLLCFIIMGYSTSEMAMITHKSASTLRTGKFRLRAKLNVENDYELLQKLSRLTNIDLLEIADVDT